MPVPASRSLWENQVVSTFFPSPALAIWLMTVPSQPRTSALTDRTARLRSRTTCFHENRCRRLLLLMIDTRRGLRTGLDHGQRVKKSLVIWKQDKAILFRDMFCAVNFYRNASGAVDCFYDMPQEAVPLLLRIDILIFPKTAYFIKPYGHMKNISDYHISDAFHCPSLKQPAGPAGCDSPCPCLFGRFLSSVL